jgi:hypothetical protein
LKLTVGRDAVLGFILSFRKNCNVGIPWAYPYSSVLERGVRYVLYKSEQKRDDAHTVAYSSYWREERLDVPTVLLHFTLSGEVQLMKVFLLSGKECCIRQTVLC